MKKCFLPILLLSAFTSAYGQDQFTIQVEKFQQGTRIGGPSMMLAGKGSFSATRKPSNGSHDSRDPTEALAENAIEWFLLLKEMESMEAEESYQPLVDTMVEGQRAINNWSFDFQLSISEDVLVYSAFHEEGTIRWFKDDEWHYPPKAKMPGSALIYQAEGVGLKYNSVKLASHHIDLVNEDLVPYVSFSGMTQNQIPLDLLNFDELRGYFREGTYELGSQISEIDGYVIHEVRVPENSEAAVVLVWDLNNKLPYFVMAAEPEYLTIFHWINPTTVADQTIAMGLTILNCQNPATFTPDDLTSIQMFRVDGYGSAHTIEEAKVSFLERARQHFSRIQSSTDVIDVLKPSADGKSPDILIPLEDVLYPRGEVGPDLEGSNDKVVDSNPFMGKQREGSRRLSFTLTVASVCALVLIVFMVYFRRTKS